MIKKLKKRLTLIFVCSIMSIFTLVFCLFITENIKSEKEEEMNYFGRMATYLVLQLENSSDLNLDLEVAEQFYDFLLRLAKPDNTTLYISPSTSDTDIDTILTAFEEERQNVLTAYSTSSTNIQSSLSGTYTFSTPDNRSFYGIVAEIIAKDGEYVQLYIIKEATTSTVLLKNHLAFYITTWLIVFVLILFLARLLISTATKPTESALQSQKEFIASASHELKSPLAVILSSAECIGSDETLSTENKQHTEIIDSECMRMSKLVQDLLLLSSADANTWTLNTSDIDVDTLLINIYEKYEPICSQKTLFFKLGTNDELYPHLKGDLDRIHQILSIFIDNAITYSFPKSEISLDATTAKNMIIFSVTDHGMGIKDKDKPFIYDRFFCADKSRTHKEHYGLGLSIAKELVEMHKGTIELADTPGGGCTFKISLPL